MPLQEFLPDYDAFRIELENLKGKYIVELQDTQRANEKPANGWGVKTRGDMYVGPNMMGQLLMELRDNSRLEYKLPNDALVFTENLKK